MRDFLMGVISLVICAAFAQVPDVEVPAARETAPVGAAGDAADDPAIWVAPSPEQSRIIGTQKKGGFYVFDLTGAVVQELITGKPNNVDLRDGFTWREGASPIVGASDRSDNTVVLWRFDSLMRSLETHSRLRIPTGFAEVYGFCLGKRGPDVIAVATSKEGDVGIWNVTAALDGGLSAQKIGGFALGSISEGCVVDDELGQLYIAEENVGIWRIDLQDPNGSRRESVDKVGSGVLVEDVEGLALWSKPGGQGYLVASVQGDSRYAVYERRAPNKYLGAFSIGASRDAKADGVQGTDGIDVTSASLGADFPSGLLVVQDDENTTPAALQNFKLVSWAEIAAALKLP